MAITLSQPPLVRQTTTMSCWAAAFESWCRVMGLTSSSHAQSNMMSLLQTEQGSLFADGSASNRGISTVSHLGLMSFQVVRGARLTASFFEQTLRQKGHIYLPFLPGFGMPGGHVVVVYGVTDQHILVMDPDPSVNFPCHIPFDLFISRRRATVCTSIINTNFSNPFN